MTLMFCLFCISVLAEACLHFRFQYKPWRLPLVGLGAVTTLIASSGLLIEHPNILTGFIMLVSLYRVFNDVRVLKGRMNERYLRWATWRTSYILIGAQVVTFAGWWLWDELSLSHGTIWLLFEIVQCIAAIILLASVTRRLRRTLPSRINKHYSDAELPSLTVAIPARNETEDLEQCLESIIASTYPKLEIIVLDDCSQNKHTPEIIRSFAHAGVRFIQGDQPKKNWLAKNQAYNRLVRESSGEFILFCGVDVRFRPESMTQLVSLALGRDKQMISVLPLRQPGERLRASVIQAMRYWWELVPPRRLFNRPAVLSTCWLVERKALQKTGGFPAVTRDIVPEAYFAKAMLRGDRYSFLRSDSVMGITSTKSRSDQLATAIRMRYPQLHRRPEQVLLAACAELLFLVLPFLTLIMGWHVSFALTFNSYFIAALTTIVLIISYARMVLATGLNNLPYALIGLPIMVLADIAVLHRSMWQYEFSEVAWKDRNVCVPVMHTYPSLPKVPQ